MGGELAIKQSEYKQNYDGKAGGQLAGDGRRFSSVEGRPKEWKKLDLPTEKKSHFKASFNAYPYRQDLQDQLKEALRTFKDRNGEILGNHFSKMPGASVYKQDYVKASPADLAQASFNPLLFAGVENYKTSGQPRLSAGYKSAQPGQTTYKAHHIDFHVRLCDCDPSQPPQRSAQSAASSRKSGPRSANPSK